jgi:serine/threonine-protein kinase
VVPPVPDAAALPELIALQKALIGRYSIEREIGRGGMGIVFLARDVALDRPVAIKLLPPAMAAQAALRERFLREAQMAAKLSHPNIIPIYAVEQAGEFVFFVMAFVDGDTLGHRLRAKGPLSPTDGTRLIQEVAWALAYAHARGIVHRDVKPDNILLEAATGRALVSDFGIARATDTSGGTAVGEVLGTAQYMSPEQACGEPVDARSDLYSLGVVAFFALSGKLPFDAPDVPALLAQHITKPAPALASVAPGVPKRLARAVDRCLAKDPTERFETGEALAEAVAQTTEVARETPAPIRVWLTRGEGLRVALYGWTGLLGLGTVAEIVMWVMGRPEQWLDNLPWLFGPWIAFGLYRLYHTQRVLAAGYSLEDMRLALRQHIEKRREELAFEYDREPPLWARALRKLAFGGLALAAAGAAYAWVAPIPSVGITAWLLGGGSALAVGCALLGRLFPGKRLKARDSMLEYRAKLFEGPIGKQLIRFASIGLTRAVPAAATHRPTEVAIGLAAEALFEALPKETRKQLRPLPGVVRALENDARALRARVDELNGMLADVAAEREAPAPATLQHSAAELADTRHKLTAELTATRDLAAKRLAQTVAALENIRLDLLRLKAGVGSVDELSAELTAAEELQAELKAVVQGQQAVDRLLTTGEATPKPA